MSGLSAPERDNNEPVIGGDKFFLILFAEKFEIIQTRTLYGLFSEPQKP